MDIEKKVIEIISDILKIPKDKINKKSKLQDFGANELNLLDILKTLKTQLEINNTDEDLQNLQTVEDFIDYAICYYYNEDDICNLEFATDCIDTSEVIAIVSANLNIPHTDLDLDARLVEDLHCSISDLRFLFTKLGLDLDKIMDPEITTNEIIKTTCNLF